MIACRLDRENLGVARRRSSQSSEISEDLRRWAPSAFSWNLFGATVPAAKRVQEFDLDALKQGGRDGGNKLGEYRLTNNISYVRDLFSCPQRITKASLSYEMKISVWAIPAL